MRKRKEYKRVRFSAEVLNQASEKLREIAAPDKDTYTSSEMSVDVQGAIWKHDSEEEFFADYRQSDKIAEYSKTYGDFSISMFVLSNDTTIAIKAPLRRDIETVFQIFESNLSESMLPEPEEAPPPPKPDLRVFIGHGRSQLWRDLKDHLTDKHDIEVEAYEIGARAGHAIRDVLEEMLNNSTFALLVLTGEDLTKGGKKRARQNVVHEAGLFQGRLGFSRAIMLVEEGVEEFSNVKGVEQIRFSAGKIKETFGDVLATIRREFPHQDA